MRIKDLSDGRIEYDTDEGRMIGRRSGDFAIRDALRVTGPQRCRLCDHFFTRPHRFLAVVDRLDHPESLIYIPGKHNATIFAREFTDRGLNEDTKHWACVQVHRIAVGERCQTFEDWAAIINARTA